MLILIAMVSTYNYNISLIILCPLITDTQTDTAYRRSQLLGNIIISQFVTLFIF